MFSGVGSPCAGGRNLGLARALHAPSTDYGALLCVASRYELQRRRAARSLCSWHVSGAVPESLIQLRRRSLGTQFENDVPWPLSRRRSSEIIAVSPSGSTCRRCAAPHCHASRTFGKQHCANARAVLGNWSIQPEIDQSSSFSRSTTLGFFERHRAGPRSPCCASV